jgi:hypothetical protein
MKASTHPLRATTAASACWRAFIGVAVAEGVPAVAEDAAVEKCPYR